MIIKRGKAKILEVMPSTEEKVDESEHLKKAQEALDLHAKRSKKADAKFMEK